jgi:wyosine [tRNA(Phe)-imidazoG37] synthetase (radical SAM superfamily)
MLTNDDRCPTGAGQAFQQHPRNWRNNLYVYPVLSRRARGLSIGINLNPDKACNFDCIYCQVNRAIPPVVRRVNLELLGQELGDMLARARSGEIFAEPGFAGVPSDFKRLNDVAFSGDGEPTASPVFLEAVRLAAETKMRLGLQECKLICITDAAFLDRPKVREALAVMDQHNGEVWAKLDAGTEEYFRRVNRANCSLDHIVANIVEAALVRPLVIQSLWMRIDGRGPSDPELAAFADRLIEVGLAGGRLKLVQVYTVARIPAEACVTALSDAELQHIGDLVRRRTNLAVEVFSPQR